MLLSAFFSRYYTLKRLGIRIRELGPYLVVPSGTVTEGPPLPKIRDIIARVTGDISVVPSIHYAPQDIEYVSQRMQLPQPNSSGNNIDIVSSSGSDSSSALPTSSLGVIQRILSHQYSSGPQLNAAIETACQRAYQQHSLDTGSPEVQCARYTCRILAQQRHLQHHRTDINTKRHLVQLVHTRLRMLQYLRRVDLGRYHRLLDGLGLPHNYIEMFENPYLFRYRRVKNPYKPEAPVIRADLGKPQRNSNATITSEAI